MSSSSDPSQQQQNNESEQKDQKVQQKDEQFKSEVQSYLDRTRSCLYVMDINEIHRSIYGTNMGIEMFRMYLDLENDAGQYDVYGDIEQPPLSCEEGTALHERRIRNLRNRAVCPYSSEELYPDVDDEQDNNSNNDHHNNNNNVNYNPN